MARKYSHEQFYLNPSSISCQKQVESRPTASVSAATASHSAFLIGAHSEPAGIAATLSRMDRATQARLIKRLEQERGNAYVQRVVAAVHEQVMQRPALSSSRHRSQTRRDEFNVKKQKQRHTNLGKRLLKKRLSRGVRLHCPKGLSR